MRPFSMNTTRWETSRASASHGHDKQRGAVACNGLHGLEHLLDEFRIERGGDLVKRDELGVHRQGACDRDALLLPESQEVSADDFLGLQEQLPMPMIETSVEAFTSSAPVLIQVGRMAQRLRQGQADGAGRFSLAGRDRDQRVAPKADAPRPASPTRSPIASPPRSATATARPFHPLLRHPRRYVRGPPR